MMKSHKEDKEGGEWGGGGGDKMLRMRMKMIWSSNMNRLRCKARRALTLSRIKKENNSSKGVKIVIQIIMKITTNSKCISFCGNDHGDDDAPKYQVWFVNHLQGWLIRFSGKGEDHSKNRKTFSPFPSFSLFCSLLSFWYEMWKVENRQKCIIKWCFVLFV